MVVKGPRPSEQTLSSLVAAHLTVAAAGADYESVTRAIAEQAAVLTGADSASVLLLEGTDLVVRAVHGRGKKNLGSRMPVDASLSGWAMRHNCIARSADIVNDLRADRAAVRAYGARSGLAAPLRHGDKEVGAVIAVSQRPDAFSDAHVEVLGQIASVLGMALTLATSRTDLCAAQNQLDRFFDLSVDLLCITDLEGNVLRVSHSVEAMLGYTPEQFATMRIAELMHPEDVAAAERGSAAARERAQFAPTRSRLRHADGSYRSLSWLTRVDGARMYSVARDVTDALAAQERLVQQERLRALGEMASGIAHDFNNALAPVIGFSELLLTQDHSFDDRARVRRYVEMIHRGATDAADVVRRLREMYRKREAADALGTVRLSTVVEHVVDLTRPRWHDQSLAQGRRIGVRVNAQPAPFVAGVEAELREALTNLLFNAVDAVGEDGTITLATGTAPDGRAFVAVTDSGAGMSDETRRRCLEPFFTTKGERGTGLGLPMVAATAARHGGELRIDSAPGCGTTVSLLLPAAAEAGAASDGAAAPPVLAQELLVVDDEPAVRAATAALLRHDGHTVYEASSGEEAIEALCEIHPAAVITDGAMPGLTGHQLAHEIKAQYPQMPVVLLTGFGDLLSPPGETPSSIDLVLSKPTSLNELRAALAKVAV